MGSKVSQGTANVDTSSWQTVTQLDLADDVVELADAKVTHTGDSDNVDFRLVLIYRQPSTNETVPIRTLTGIANGDDTQIIRGKPGMADSVRVEAKAQANTVDTRATVTAKSN